MEKFIRRSLAQVFPTPTILAKAVESSMPLTELVDKKTLSTILDCSLEPTSPEETVASLNMLHENPAIVAELKKYSDSTEVAKIYNLAKEACDSLNPRQAFLENCPKILERLGFEGVWYVTKPSTLCNNNYYDYKFYTTEKVNEFFEKHARTIDELNTIPIPKHQERKEFVKEVYTRVYATLLRNDGCVEISSVPAIIKRIGLDGLEDMVGTVRSFWDSIPQALDMVGVQGTKVLDRIAAHMRHAVHMHEEIYGANERRRKSPESINNDLLSTTKKLLTYTSYPLVIRWLELIDKITEEITEGCANSLYRGRSRIDAILQFCKNIEGLDRISAMKENPALITQTLDLVLKVGENNDFNHELILLENVPDVVERLKSVDESLPAQVLEYATSVNDPEYFCLIPVWMEHSPDLAKRSGIEATKRLLALAKDMAKDGREHLGEKYLNFCYASKDIVTIEGMEYVAELTQSIDKDKHYGLRDSFLEVAKELIERTGIDELTNILDLAKQIMPPGVYDSRFIKQSPRLIDLLGYEKLPEAQRVYLDLAKSYKEAEGYYTSNEHQRINVLAESPETIAQIVA